MNITVSKEYPVIGWISAGCASALAVKIAIDWFGIDNVLPVFIDTFNEDDDSYRFLTDLERLYGKKILHISNKNAGPIEDIWEDNLSLNTATGAVCSSTLKVIARQDFIKRTNFSYQVFGFDINEIKRARKMLENNPHLNPIFPLIVTLKDKKACLKYFTTDLGLWRIELPLPYRLGVNNNNCFKTGCVQGGIGYWQWMEINQPPKFDAMAEREHRLSKLKGSPVTICKDQSKGGGLVFLKHNPDFPTYKDISMIKGRPPELLFECDGFCNNK